MSYVLLLMSSFNNQGGLWDNQRKFEPNHPDFVGQLNINGIVYELAAWKSSSTNPKSPTINIKVQAAVVPMQYEQPVAKEKKDDIPF